MKVARFEFSLFGINTYVIWDPQTLECCIIDPGMSNSQERKALTDFISKMKLTVVHVINTHLHIDHAIGNSFVEETYGRGSEASKSDEFLAKGIQHQAAMYGIEETVGKTEISHYLEDGDIIKIGKGALEVIAVPGHSPGSLAFYDSEDGYLFSGDALFNRSIGRTDLPGGDFDTLIDSIKGKLFHLPPSTIVYPGHGPETTIGDEMKSNPFLR